MHLPFGRLGLAEVWRVLRFGVQAAATQARRDAPIVIGRVEALERMNCHIRKDFVLGYDPSISYKQHL